MPQTTKRPRNCANKAWGHWMGTINCSLAYNRVPWLLGGEACLSVQVWPLCHGLYEDLCW